MLPPSFDLHQFNKRAKVVTATTGIAYSDYGKMHVEHRSAAVCRRKPIPEWANNDVSLREVVLRFCEAYLYIRPPANASNEERLAVIAERSRAALEVKKADLQRALAKYHAAAKAKSSEEYLRRLAIQVANRDKQCVVLTRGIAALVTAVIVQSYRLGRDSSTVAQELNVLPPMVRIWLHRCNRIAEGKPKSHYQGMRNPKTRWPEKDLRRLHMLRSAGCTWKEVGNALAVSAASAMLHWQQAKRAMRGRSSRLKRRE